MNKLVFFDGECGYYKDSMFYELNPDGYQALRKIFEEEDILVTLSPGCEWAPANVTKVINFEDDGEVFCNAVIKIGRQNPEWLSAGGMNLLSATTLYKYVGFYD